MVFLWWKKNSHRKNGLEPFSLTKWCITLSLRYHILSNAINLLEKMVTLWREWNNNKKKYCCISRPVLTFISILYIFHSYAKHRIIITNVRVTTTNTFEKKKFTRQTMLWLSVTVLRYVCFLMMMLLHFGIKKKMKSKKKRNDELIEQ